MEDAFPTFQKKCSELFEANLILQAQVDVLQRQLDAANKENARLRQPDNEPAPGGSPDPATQPPHQSGDQS
jgi:hypothetical protein